MEKIPESVDVLVVGGGASGIFCAVNLAGMTPDIRVVVVEKSQKLLAKVKVSGGGRCNVTTSVFHVRDLVHNYPRGSRELQQAFSRFGPRDTVSWFEDRGVELKTEEDGRIFPVSDDSQTIIDTLLEEAQIHGVRIFTGFGVKELSFVDPGFIVKGENGHQIKAKCVVVATGGGRNKESFEWLKSTGHSVSAPVPSLFTFNMPGDPVRELMGVAVELAEVSIPQIKLTTEGPLLITHWGMSGPAVLKASAFGAVELARLQYNFKVSINWLTGRSEDELFSDLSWYKMQHPVQKVYSSRHTGLPSRLWEHLCDKSGIVPDMKWADLPHKLLRNLVQLLLRDEYEVRGKTTFKEEFVTAGGISRDELDFRTMQSRKCKGLYFAGEVVDVDGVTGGFNFQFAWTSGFLAATDISQSFIAADV